MLVALAVSLLVNDTPVDVIGFGALGCLALLAVGESVNSRRMRRGALTAAWCRRVLATCRLREPGHASSRRRTPSSAPSRREAPGKAIFITQGCGGCHTTSPAAPMPIGNIGPDLDKLPAYAKTANQPLATFVHESIVDPNKYIEKGYPKDVMPKSYASLPASDLHDLVDFLSKPQG